MNSSQIRQSFLDFFKEKGHKIVPSSPLIPKDDPTLLFANAGMNQFKDIITGKKKAEFKKVASSQKCIRVSGKHNDLEEVGKDTYHHTFFEMLGNWSFGDYFKKEAISFAWEYLTKVCGLPKDRLWATVFKDDNESEKLWYENTDLIKGRVLRFDEKENFWEMGEVGPCGPCSEILYDKGEKYACGPKCGANCKCGRFIEVWNLVFMEFYRDENGKLTDLPAKNVDTGMGLERLAAILQKVDSNYETDLFLPLIKQVEKMTNKSYGNKQTDSMNHTVHTDVSFRVIADHIRTLSFAIADGAIPSNEGRGYVLRRILRRASRHGRLLGLHKPFIYTLSSTLVDMMGKTYPELTAKKEHIALVIKSEEERFEETLDLGIELFEKASAKVIKSGEKIIPGKEVFKLYDTYGFPVDLIQVMAKEKNLQVDLEGFNEEMKKQQERSRSSMPVYLEPMIDKAELLHRKTEAVHHQGICEMKVNVLSASYDTSPDIMDSIILDITPFYAEAGGQVSDTGKIIGKNFEFEVHNVVRKGDVVLHMGKTTKGRLTAENGVMAIVDIDRRKTIMRNHTATHLLHKALKEVLGEHVNQSGSLVAPDRLRFDFTHSKAMDKAQIDGVERKVNQKIWENLEVETFEKNYDEAKKMGAIALFGEKYEEKVRVVKAGDYSMELCGGTHVKATGEIGIFKIISESGISAGIRRIEAITGEEAYKLFKKQSEILDDLNKTLRVSNEGLLEKVNQLIRANKELDKKAKELQTDSAKDEILDLGKQAIEMDGIKIIIYKADTKTREDLMKLADALREKLKSTVGVLATTVDNQIGLVIAVTDDLIKNRNLKAGDIAKEVSELVGGKGGGKPHLAQGGGKDIEKLDSALEKVPQIIKKMLK
ncbi:MAG: alanine--tRNA ligase [candidate division Zixibacteria bacterium]|nr:alanine--tRNA ligase [candidate division Zixibacteria bacterium]